MQLGGDAATFRQLARGQSGVEVLERTPIAAQAEVSQGTGGQEAAQQVERLGAGRGFPGPIRFPRLDRKPIAYRLREWFDEPAVSLEQRVTRGLVGRMRQLRAAMVEIPAVGSRAVEPNVAGRLLQG